jgi:MFS family permease
LDRETKNLFLFTTLSTVWAIIFGLIGPFYVIHVERLSGGMEKLGIAFGIMIFFQSLASYVAGKSSDKLGRKPFLFLIAYVNTVILFLYTVIKGTYQLYILQGLFGISNGVSQTISTSLLGDITTREKRGRAVGIFHAIVGIASSVGLVLSGYAVKVYGLKTIFYLASFVLFFSTLLLFGIREDIVLDHKENYQHNPCTKD